MKKLLAMAIIVGAVFGAASFAVPGGECGAGETAGLPADAACHDSGDPQNPADDRDCLVWFASAPDPAVGDCVEAPSA